MFAADSHESTQQVQMTASSKALIKVTGPDVKLSLSGPSEAGADPTKAFGHDSYTRLKMSALTEGSAAYKIEASVTGSPTMDGSNSRLFLRLLPPTSASYDAFKNYETAADDLKFGTAEFTEGDREAFLSDWEDSELVGNTAITLVDGIGTAWTGTEEDHGYVIEYNYFATGASAVSDRTITVTFTITQ